MKIKSLIVLTNLLFLLYANIAYTQPVDLGLASTFSVFSAAGAFSNDGATQITGDIGTHVGAFTGFPPGIVVGQIHVADGVSASAASDVSTAYSDLAGKTCGMVLGTTMGSGQVLTPNIYCLGAASTLNGTLTLDGQGNPNSVFIFQIDGALATGTAAHVVLTNSANLCNVYWQINGAFYLGPNASFQGTVLAGGQITLDIGSSLNGRALTTAGAIILHTTTVSGIFPPVASISASGSTQLCEGTSITLTAPTANVYSWSNGATTKSIMVSTAGNYSVTITDACGTATSAPTAITVVANPTASISAGGPLTFCEGGSVTLTASGGGTYLWSTGATTASIVVNASGNYTVTATNAAGCTGISAGTAVTVNANPGATISAGGSTTFCLGENVVLTASAGSAYLWSTGATSQSITAATSGNYSVTVTNASGCSAVSAATTVTVNSLAVPVITANGPTTFCPGGSVILTSSIASGNLWSTGATTQSIVVTTAGPYTVTNQSTCGGTSAATMISVSTGAIPTISAGGPLTFCTGGSVTLTSSIADGYLWSTGATTQSITVSATGNYSVATTGTCSGTSLPTAVSIMALSVPTISANGPTSICTGGNVILTSSVASSYLWSTSATTQSITVTAAGNYSVTNTGSCGGTSAATMVSLITPQIPTISANGPLTFCPGGSVMLTSSVANGILWSNGAMTQSITITTPGSYSVTNTANCGETSAITMVVISAGAIPTISANGPLTFCTGGSVVLTSSTADGYLWSTGATTKSITVTTTGSYTVTTSGICAGSSVPTEVTVKNISAPTISVSGPTTFCTGGSVMLTSSASSGNLWSNGATTQSITVNVGGNYTVSTMEDCAVSSVPILITISDSANPTVSLNGPLSFCLEDSVILTASIASGYLWSTGATTQSITVKEAGNYSVTTTGICAGTSSVTTLAILPATIPIISANGPLLFCQGDSVTLTSSDGISYLWSTGETTQSIRVKSSGSYSVTTSGGCGGLSANTEVTVNASAIPTISARGPLSFCLGDSVTLTSSTASHYLWSNGDTTQIIVVKNAGSYTVSTPGMCAGTSIPTLVSLNSFSSPTIVPLGPINLCIGDSVKLTASSSSGYQWSTSDTSRSITVKKQGIYTVYIPGACSDTSLPVIVTLNSTSGSVITASGPTSMCEGDKVILTASKGSSYAWSFGGKTQTVLVRNSGTYWVTITNECGTKSAASIKIVVNPIPDCTIIATSPLCAVNGTQLCATGGDNAAYRWSNGDTTQCITLTQAGTYSVTITNPSGCSSTCSKTILASQFPDCTISGDTSICLTQTSILSAIGGDLTYLWNNGATTQSIAIWDAGIYTVSVTNPYGCVSTCSKKVTITSNSCIIMGKLNICAPETTELKGPMGASSYLWNTGSTSGWMTVYKPGTYSLAVTYSDGCVDHCSVVVTSEGCIDCLPGYKNFVSTNTVVAQQNASIRNLSISPNQVENDALGAGNLTIQAFPNPFVNYTNIYFSSPISQKVTVEIYNIRGQIISSLFEGLISRNERHQVRFDASHLTDGLYFYRITEGKYSINKKLILLKN
ncbi:MAG: ice-binding family protein [Saprospiraceae bacterium]